MTELPINCCPGSTTPVSPHCIAEDYLMRHCPILKEVNKASKHACPLKDRIFVCECGHFADRDRNAAQNIERQALKMFAGVGSRRTETHVEQMLDSQEQSVMKRENMAEERQPSNPAVV